MAIVEVGSEVYNIPDKVASKVLDLFDKIEELEMEVRKLKKDVLDGEIHWHSQKRKRMAEKRKKLKYKQTINEAIEYIEKHKQIAMFADLRKEGTHQYTIECDADELLKILKGEVNEKNNDTNNL